MMMLMRGCAGCVETERMGLLQLKSHLKNLYNVTEESFLKSWRHNDSKSNCCLWERVNCSDTIGGHIVNLTLDYINHYTSVPRPLNLSLFHSFPQLETLDLSWNYLTELFDPIHGYKSFQRLEKLRTLIVYINRFNNSVLPFISAAKSLMTLDLSSNQLEGVFSLNDEVFPSSLQVLNLGHNQLSLTHEGYSEICRLRYLRELGLSSNALTNLPNCLGNLSHLRTLDLSNNQLNGDLSSFVSDLPSALEYLSLLQNNFNGSFFFKSLVNHTRLTVFRLSSKVGMIQAHTESSWVPLFQLKMLQLQNFMFGSTIPGFLVHQHDLLSIDISHNKLKGAFPTWLVQNNTRLQTISLNSNSLTKLQLPRLVHGLEVLDISSNRIYGTIQDDLWIVFPKLRYMDFSSNHFHGTIPSSMGEMKSLLSLDISSNDLYGQLPEMFLSGCYSLEFLKLSNNQFHGKIFPEHVNLTGLASLYLGGNSFNGSLEKGLLKLKNLQFLDISDNRFSGILPLWMGRMSRLLYYLDMSGNQLKGPFPVQLQDLPLFVIDISHNSFSGSIPRNVSFIGRELKLQNNEFMGSIPDTLFKSPSLEVIDLRNNNLSGKIPDTIGKASKLKALLLRNNSLQSHTLEKICQLSQIDILDLSHNKFKGVIPSCLGNMSFGGENNDGLFSLLNYGLGISIWQNWRYTSALSLNDLEDLRNGHGSSPPTTVDFVTKNRYEAYQGGFLSYMSGLDLSSNQLSGEIPIEIGDLENIRCLNLSSNHLTGSIPKSFSKLKNLESLDLSNNKLDGNIPPILADLNNLGYFIVSYNNLSGEIPFKGHLVTFDRMSYIGNAHLCGLPTNKICNPTGVLEPSASKQAKEEEGDDDVIDMVWFYWTCGAVYISTYLALFVFLCIDSHWSRKWYYGVDLFIYHLQRFKGRLISS